MIQDENTSQRVQLLQRIKTRQLSVSPIKGDEGQGKQQGALCSTPKFKKKHKPDSFMQKQIQVIEQQKANEK